MIGRMLLCLPVLALACFSVLVMIGLWDRYAQETMALGFSGIYERYLASQGGFPHDAKAYRASTEGGRRPQAGNIMREMTEPEE